MDDLWQLYGAWFEEVFCDGFGTLMLGPAYGVAMLELFTTPDDAQSPMRINTSASGYAYDHHPPRHLRVMLCVATLNLLGQEDDALKLAHEWSGAHPGLEDAFLLPTRGRWLAFEAAPLLDLGFGLVQQLYTEQFVAFAGYRLPNIPGVDFGPAENARAERAKAEFLAGRRTPTTHERWWQAPCSLPTRSQHNVGSSSPSRAAPFQPWAPRSTNPTPMTCLCPSAILV
ncbi:MAG: hypothetical protein JRH20_05155, partial [Deltaproteobacteria bacterium]|nr:hypothetical protein [Deltaproteobacteria bacterium]